MMAERLAVSEGKLLKMHADDVIKNLVAAKMELAQAQYETLEAQVCLQSAVHAILIAQHPGLTNVRHTQKMK